MASWNASYTQLIRKGRRAHWGNWALSAQIAPGAVGVVDPETGEFKLVEKTIPAAQVQTRQQATRWELMSEHVSRQQGQVSLDGSAVDPETGTKVTAGLEVKWGLEKSGSMVSEFSLGSEAYLLSFGDLLNGQYDWLASKAASVGMNGGKGGISQGFGVITSVLWANSGLNVAAQDENTTFSVTGSVSGVNELVGQAEGKGSYTSATANKSVDKHIWPDKENTLPPGAIPIAYTFASFDGRLIIPNWTMQVGSFQLVLNNQHGGTYIVNATLDYDTPQGKRHDEASVSGGLIATMGAIPLTATNLTLNLTFKGVFSDEHKSFRWNTPLGTWYDGTRHIDLSGVWPGQTGAVDAEASLRP